ncbi:MAG: beta-lactamase family protein [Mucilaginibacter polytrichastri]|nr:beta-lactamase family protein [Mucilaginibacter polytrichastri]
MKRFIFIAIAAFAVLQHPFVSAQNRQQLEKIDAYLHKLVHSGNVAGLSVAIVKKDRVLLSKGYGLSSEGKPVGAETPFAIASLSKAFTAKYMHTLADSGRISLDSPFTRYLDGARFRDGQMQKITVRQLLDQTSGLSDRVFPELSLANPPQNATEFLGAMRNVQPAEAPGTRYHYHNPNYVLLALLAESVSRHTLAQDLEQAVFRPLGMRHTFAADRTGDIFGGEKGIPRGHIYAFGKALAAPEPAWYVNGAAGMVSTAGDMALWLQEQLRHPPLRYPEKGGEKGTVYRSGWYVRPDGSLYHSGIFWTNSAELVAVPGKDYAVVLLFNGGINAFRNYAGYLEDVETLLNGAEQSPPVTPAWVWAALLILVLAVALYFGIRRLKKQRNARKSGMLYFVCGAVLRLLPLISVCALPALLTALSGRVLSFYRIFLMMPDGLSVLLLIAVLQVIILLRALFFRVKTAGRGRVL